MSANFHRALSSGAFRLDVASEISIPVMSLTLSLHSPKIFMRWCTVGALGQEWPGCVAAGRHDGHVGEHEELGEEGNVELHYMVRHCVGLRREEKPAF